MSKERTKKTPKHTSDRKKLPDVRPGLTKKAKACGFKYYVTVNFFDDGSPAEIFCKVAKEGSAISGFVECLMICISIALQYGTPWNVLFDKYIHQQFEPKDDENSSLIHAIATTIDEIVTKEQHNCIVTGK